MADELDEPRHFIVTNLVGLYEFLPDMVCHDCRKSRKLKMVSLCAEGISYWICMKCLDERQSQPGVEVRK